MNPICECPVAGFCTRHLMVKGPLRHQYCQGVGSRAIDYWRAWEQGTCEATAPANPDMNPEGFSIPAEPDESSIGTALHDIFLGEGAEPCEDCQKSMARLNRMTPDEVEAIRGELITELKQRAKTQAPRLWQRLGVMVDEALHTGIADAKFDAWITQAIETGKEKPEPIKQKSEESTVKNVRCCGS